MTLSKKKSGTRWSDSDYQRAGYARLSLRLKERDKIALTELAEKNGESVSATIARLIHGGGT